jgi:hypothetical protein
MNSKLKGNFFLRHYSMENIKNRNAAPSDLKLCARLKLVVTQKHLSHRTPKETYPERTVNSTLFNKSLLTFSSKVSYWSLLYTIFGFVLKYTSRCRHNGGSSCLYSVCMVVIHCSSSTLVMIALSTIPSNS